MKRLHKIGFVHRDVSIGNFLIFFNLNDLKWLLQLTDYEYIRVISGIKRGEQALTVGRYHTSGVSVLILQS